MTYRTTFAFDQSTIQRLKKLSSRWNVSQAETIRRALSQAEQSDAASQPDPVSMLKTLHTSGRGLSKKAGAAYLKEVYHDRKHWRTS